LKPTGWSQANFTDVIRPRRELRVSKPDVVIFRTVRNNLSNITWFTGCVSGPNKPFRAGTKLDVRLQGVGVVVNVEVAEK
jgi:hypothetical protein